jgi:uncharacterized protein YhfF
MKYYIAMLCCVFLCGCIKEQPSKSVDPVTASDQDINESSKHHIVLEILGRPQFRNSMPACTEITLQKYRELKAEYAKKHGNWDSRYALTYRERDGEDWRKYWLTLESFDNDMVWIAELTQYKSKGWDWIARYRLNRIPEVDEDFRINQILEERSKVFAGIKYGMSVDEVLAKKGKHYKLNVHAEAGSADLIYDDIKVSVREWWPGSSKGRIVRVEPTSDRTKDLMKNISYEYEK